MIRRRETELISDENKLLEVKVIYEMKILDFKDFMKNYILKKITKNESDLQRVYNFPIYPRDSEIYSDKGFVNFDNGSIGRTHWVCFYLKMINHITLIVSVVSQINFYLINYLNL